MKKQSRRPSHVSTVRVLHFPAAPPEPAVHGVTDTQAEEIRKAWMKSRSAEQQKAPSLPGDLAVNEG